jgi:hypothetical protein
MGAGGLPQSQELEEKVQPSEFKGNLFGAGAAPNYEFLFIFYILLFQEWGVVLADRNLIKDFKKKVQLFSL